MKFDDLVKIDERADKGAWIDTLRNLPGVKLKVRGEMNADHEKALAELWSKLPSDKRDDPAEAERIETEALAAAILVDWDGLEDTPFTPENATRALALRTFRQEVIFASRIVASRGSLTLEADAKN